MKRIEISFHALERMKERGITEEEIEQTLSNPDKQESKKDISLAMKLRKNGHLLIAVYKENNHLHKIITVIDTSKLEKYL